MSAGSIPSLWKTVYNGNETIITFKYIINEEKNMQCPKCRAKTDFQVVVKDGVKYLKCDTCGALLTSSDIREYMQQPQPPKTAKTPKKSNPITGFITLIILIILAVMIFGPDNKADSKEHTKTEKAAETDGYGWTKKDYQEFRSITWTMSDKYVANYKKFFSDPDTWKYAKFDDEGKIMVTTSYAFKNSNEKQYVISIFTRGDDKDNDGVADSFSPHFLSIGDTIYINDGSCDEFFQNLQESMQYFE